MKCEDCGCAGVETMRFHTDIGVYERNWLTVYLKCDAGHKWSVTAKGGWPIPEGAGG